MSSNTVSIGFKGIVNHNYLYWLEMQCYNIVSMFWKSLSFKILKRLNMKNKSENDRKNMRLRFIVLKTLSRLQVMDSIANSVQAV